MRSPSRGLCTSGAVGEGRRRSRHGRRLWRRRMLAGRRSPPGPGLPGGEGARLPFGEESRAPWVRDIDDGNEHRLPLVAKSPSPHWRCGGGKGTFGWRVCAGSCNGIASGVCSPRQFLPVQKSTASDGQVVILGTPIARSMTHVAKCAPVRLFDAGPLGPGTRWLEDAISFARLLDTRLS